MSAVRNICSRCGKCCRKGGPGLHLEDRELIREHVLEPEDLVCFRQGEFVFDQVKQRLVSLDTELIKIRGKKSGWECVFYDPTIQGCRIYRNRPLECRTLMCWNTAPIESLMERGDRLTRAHLASGDSGLAQLIRDHETRCSLDKVARIIRDGDMETATTRQKILDLCSYDVSFRDVLVERVGMPDTFLECYFGRPLFKAVLGHDPWFASRDFLQYFSER